MSDLAPPFSPAPSARPIPGDLPLLNSRDLFTTKKEVLIQHGAEHYRLRLTSSNKLILTK